jgi:predicted PhzF superfamily epimerase YddE/YHI9
MKLPVYQIDAFTSRLFAGNPAAVCPLEQWLPDETLQAIAAENNLSETAFFAPEDGGYRLRWFTPSVEVDLCGHATLASAFLILSRLNPGAANVVFQTRSGQLSVERDGDLLRMDFPSRPAERCGPHPLLIQGLGRAPREVLCSRDYLAVYASEADVASLRPDMDMLQRVDRFAVIVTAPGDRDDFVSRFFAPSKGVPEDPVTGSAHSTLIPFWAQRLGKKTLKARQISKRGGELWCEDRGVRVSIAGQAVLFLEGSIQLPG